MYIRAVSKIRRWEIESEKRVGMNAQSGGCRRLPLYANLTFSPGRPSEKETTACPLDKQSHP